MYIYIYNRYIYTYEEGLRSLKMRATNQNLVAGLISLLHFGGRVWDDEDFHLTRILQVLFTTDHL